MYEQDYIMRLIKEIIRSLLKLLFNIDTDSPTKDLLSEKEQKTTLEKLLDMIDEGEINKAENELSNLTESGDHKYLEVALLFYSYLNEKNDAFLEEHRFSREEISMGLKSVISQYGLGSVAEAFLTEL